MSVIVSCVLAALLVFTAVRKLSHRPAVVATYQRVGVPESRLNALAAILLAGAAGLIAGLWWHWLGVATAIGLVCYFALAVAAHVRAKDTATVMTPVVYLALSVAALVLRLI
ncbi:DoxX family protein [Streptosporangiaceae bacterium NEAU-GS5]|nr:DoxX family protein [Streptosporangiaceae bacterium NEAU-GS5]